MVGVRESEIDLVTTDTQDLSVRMSKNGQLSKSLSRSMPSIAHTGQSLSAKSLSTSSLSRSTTSKSRERKFHRFFEEERVAIESTIVKIILQLSEEEHVLIHFRCALVRDILLQGHLYITANYFAFYSNVFGYVTRLMIPMTSITDISKQRGVKFISNAVAITTTVEKHVFGSLFWKESAFKQMKEVWKDMRPAACNSLSADEELLDSESLPGDNSEDDSGIVDSQTGQTSRSAIVDTEIDEFLASNLNPAAIMTSQLSKSLSRSMPLIAHAGQPMFAISSSTSSLARSTTSKGRERKFHRLFKELSEEEHVLIHFRCALVRDILLQGHLYITANYFTFYSNVFGYVTRVMIPMASITDISRQKAVKFIPNAVAVTTAEEKHVFGSLFWKESAFKQMKEVWEDMRPEARNSLSANGELHNSECLPGDKSASVSGIVDSQTGQTSTSAIADTEIDGFSASILNPAAIMRRLHRHFEPTTIIVFLVVLLAAMLVSAVAMMMRIDRLHAAYVTHPLVSPDFVIKRYFAQYLQQNLDQIVTMRRNLQKMSQHFVSTTEGTETGPVTGGFSDLADAPS